MKLQKIILFIDVYDYLVKLNSLELENIEVYQYHMFTILPKMTLCNNCGYIVENIDINKCYGIINDIDFDKFVLTQSTSLLFKEFTDDFLISLRNIISSIEGLTRMSVESCLIGNSLKIVIDIK